MEATIMRFYEDLYATTFDTVVVGAGRDDKDTPYIVLAETIFHPHGGGQKGDRGSLTIAAPIGTDSPREYQVTDTRGEKGGVIRHLLGSYTEFEGTDVIGRPASLHLNWDFRSNQMRLHSASHLLHIFMERSLGQTLPYPKIADILEDHGLNVYDGILGISPEQMEAIVHELNRFLAKGVAIKTAPDPSNPAYRFWQCDDVVIPCGGTHPLNTTEIGQVVATVSSKKGSTKVHITVKQ